MDAGGDNCEDPYLKLGNFLTTVTIAVYEKVLDRFGASVCKKFLKDASQEEKESFVKRLKHAQLEKLEDRMEERLEVIMNRTLIDHFFIEGYNEIMSKFKSIEELRQDNEIAKNHLQSVENEYTILERDTDKAIDKFEAICAEQVEIKEHTD